MSKVVTFGELMLRLTPSADDVFLQAESFDAHFGGSEYNVACGLSSLGVSSRFITRLPENPIGQRALMEIRKHGVDAPDDTLTSEGRLGIYYLELGSSPRPNRVVYDRSGSSIAVTPDQSYKWEAYLSDASWFHVSGITPALSPSAYRATAEAIDIACEKGIPVSFDINFRVKLWSVEDAAKLLGPLLEKCRVIVSTEEDLERVFGIGEGPPKEMAEKARDMFGCDIVAITLRNLISVKRNKWGGCAYGPDGYMESRMYDIEVVDRVGAGDSFTAGLIAGLLDGGVEHAVNLAAAFSALKQTIPGDVCLADRKQAEELIKKGSAGRIQR